MTDSHSSNPAKVDAPDGSGDDKAQAKAPDVVKTKASDTSQASAAPAAASTAKAHAPDAKVSAAAIKPDNANNTGSANSTGSANNTGSTNGGNKPGAAKATLPEPSGASGKQSSNAAVWAVSLIALAVAALAGAGAFMVWRQIDDVQASGQQRVDAVLLQTKGAAAQAAASQELAQALQARMSLAEAKLSELNLQRTQLEELMLSVSRSRDDTLVQDLESSTRFALQQSSLMGSPNALIATLQAGIERINRSAQPRLNPVLQAMEADLLRLQEVAGADVPMLVAQLSQLAVALDTLPMRSMAPPLPHRVADYAQPSADVSNTAPAPVLADAGSGWLGNAWHGLQAQLQAFWQQWSGVAGQHLSGLVRVRAIDNNDAFLLSPEHAWLLRQNLKLRVLNARLALVGAQHDVAAQDLAAVAQSVSQYGEPGAFDVQALLEKLQSLQAGIQGLQVPVPQSTLSALATAAAGR